MVLKIANSLARIIYGGLTIFACIISLLQSGSNIIPSIIMLSGGLLLLLTLIKKVEYRFSIDCFTFTDSCWSYLEWIEQYIPSVTPYR